MTGAPKIRNAHRVGSQWRVSRPPSVREALDLMRGDQVASEAGLGHVTIVKVRISPA
jgi:hypothetical protein